jgi:pimeloyl-ACP methyl ester carboxylesterase
MGGIIAVGAALRRPERVRRLVLTATSGGIDVAEFGGADWREAYGPRYRHAASWITEEHADCTDAITTITAPTLLNVG